MIAPPGFQVGPYVVVGSAGRGGMADVFAATDTRTGQRVALKLVPVGEDHESRQIVEAEREGAEYQKQLWQVYRQVPEVYEYAAGDSYFYIAMELLEGQNLSELISRGPLPAERAVGIAIQICRFLEAAHTLEPTIDGRKRRSLLHGDLKPRNIRVLDGDQVKVFDFGAAKALSYSRKVTRHDFGSIAYLSPERIESGDIDAHADFWGLGVILYEMVSGAQPFQAKDTRRLESQIRARRPPRSLDHGCPLALQAVVAKLLAGAQEDRYNGAQAIREDLETVLAGGETQAQREGWPARGQDEPPTRRIGAVSATTPDTRLPTPDSEATRRTIPGSAGATTVAPVPPSQIPPPLLKPKRRFTVRQVVRAALLIVAFVIVANEINVAAAASRMAATIPSLELSDLDAAWARYRNLSDGSLGVGVIGLERALVRQTTAAADRVIANYRTPSPSVREAQWRLARGALARALAARGGDPDIEAALRYCEGHLHRINGEASKGRKQAVDAQQNFADALVAFREAAELRPAWADPYLGLMRTFVYGLDDVERGEDALAQAVSRGYQAGDRETAQLAEGHRVRADTLVRSAREVAGTGQELPYLNRAVEGYRKALGFYAQMPAVGDTARQTRLAQRGMAGAERRIAALTPAPAIETHAAEAAEPVLTPEPEPEPAPAATAPSSEP
jgi:serine/threonine protein kinase